MLSRNLNVHFIGVGGRVESHTAMFHVNFEGVEGLYCPTTSAGPCALCRMAAAVGAHGSQAESC